MNLAMLRGLLPLLFVAFLTNALRCQAREIQGKCPMGREYYLYVPDAIDPDRTYWMVVGAHAFGGNGKNAGGMKAWVERGDCLVLGPTFPHAVYTTLDGESGPQLSGLLESLHKEYKFHSKVFVTGFSGGSQFAHRFMMAYPDLVMGCAAHSGGSWSTGGRFFKDINPKASDIPFVMSCGERDTGEMHPTAPLGRLEWAKRFEGEIAKLDFLYAAKYFPGVGHSRSSGSNEMTKKCFEVAIAKARFDMALDEVLRLKQAGESEKAIQHLREISKAFREPADADELVKKVAAAGKKRLEEVQAEFEGAAFSEVDSILASDADVDTKNQQLMTLLRESRDDPKTQATARAALRKLREQNNK